MPYKNMVASQVFFRKTTVTMKQKKKIGFDQTVMIAYDELSAIVF